MKHVIGLCVAGTLVLIACADSTREAQDASVRDSSSRERDSNGFDDAQAPCHEAGGGDAACTAVPPGPVPCTSDCQCPLGECFQGTCRDAPGIPPKMQDFCVTEGPGYLGVCACRGGTCRQDGCCELPNGTIANWQSAECAACEPANGGDAGVGFGFRDEVLAAAFDVARNACGAPGAGWCGDAYVHLNTSGQIDDIRFDLGATDGFAECLVERLAELRDRCDANTTRRVYESCTLP